VRKAAYCWIAYAAGSRAPADYVIMSWSYAPGEGRLAGLSDYGKS